MRKYLENLAKALLGIRYSELGKTERDVLESIAEAEPITENVNSKFREQLTSGQRLADRISAFGGSWLFILSFMLVLAAWMGVNSFYFSSAEEAFDPYPYILLNLVLSTLAALQAPIIMMSQNRQSAKDRLEISENYKISLKMELEITRLHQKIDDLSQSSLSGDQRKRVQ